MLKKVTIQILLVTMFLLLVDADLTAQTRIRFRSGSAAASVSGKLPARAKRTYILNAKEGQSLTAELTSGNDGIRFGDNGTSLNYTTTQGVNYVYITNIGKTPTTFKLTVSIQ